MENTMDCYKISPLSEVTYEKILLNLKLNYKTQTNTELEITVKFYQTIIG